MPRVPNVSHSNSSQLHPGISLVLNITANRPKSTTRLKYIHPLPQGKKARFHLKISYKNDLLNVIFTGLINQNLSWLKHFFTFVNARLPTLLITFFKNWLLIFCSSKVQDHS